MQKEEPAEGAARGRNELIIKFQEEQEGQCGRNVVNQGEVARLGVSLRQSPDQGKPGDHGKNFGFYSDSNGRLLGWEG